mmetsp:Transcript_72040/g.234168  ORF Transcript_72040/g.234168 Transcript_72040/m.234168 type:complete len:256 (-) Transcript_72040:142-909(-)
MDRCLSETSLGAKAPKPSRPQAKCWRHHQKVRARLQGTSAGGGIEALLEAAPTVEVSDRLSRLRLACIWLQKGSDTPSASTFAASVERAPMDVRTCSITASAFLASATSAMDPQPNCTASTFLALAVVKNRPSASRFSKSGVGRGMRTFLSLQGNFWRVNTIETAVEPAPKSGCALAAFFFMTCLKARRTFAKFFRVSASAMTSSGQNFPLLPPADCRGSGQGEVRGIVRVEPRMPCAPSNSRPSFGRAPTSART